MQMPGDQTTGHSPLRAETIGPLRAEMIGPVLVLTLANPPVNVIGSAMRQGLATQIARARTDARIRAVVIRGEGRSFSAGADIAELGKTRAGPDLGSLCNIIEASPKPVIAALHGTALGGGLELALACHYRIALSTAWLGLPEVNLGLLPGAGGTQRLPRLIGAADALHLMTTGVPVAAPDALALGLLDLVVEAGLLEAALERATDAIPRPTSEATQGLSNPRAWQQAVAAARARLHAHRLPAPARIVDCVEAAGLLPFSQGLGFERAAFDDLLQSPESAGLRHAFFAERQAFAPPAGLVSPAAQRRTELGIWGARAAEALVLQALQAGLRVVLADPDRAALVATLERIATLQDGLVTQGVVSEAVRDADWARLHPVQSGEALRGIDLIFVMPGANEVPADLPAEHLVAIHGPDRWSGALVVSPAAARGGLAELALGRDAPAALAARVVGLARGLGWKLVIAGPGEPIEARLRQALGWGVSALAAQGASREAVTAALAAYGIGAVGQAVLPAMPRGGLGLVQVCLEALANQGAMLLAEGKAERACDIDAVALQSGLLPRWEGGPMYQADQRGLLVLRSSLRLRADRPGFAPAPLLDQLIAEGRTFASLNPPA